MAPFQNSLVLFVVSLLIGGLGVFVGASLLAGSRNYSHAVITAALGSLVWAVVSFLIGGIPVLGPVLVFLAYLAVIKWRYRTGWITAAGITLVAYITVLVVLAVLSDLGVGLVRDIPGVPGV
ncbi:MAG: hypothetical protein ABEJ05_08785 [Haloglomus sp.]